jgi:hypothetical protein
MRFVFASLAAASACLGLQTPAQATVHIHVDLTTQTMRVSSREGDFTWPVSTGRPGHRTPTGVYRPQRMYLSWRSHKFDNAPMPHAIFFRGGYAIHGTYETAGLGRVASHGCIRLAPQNAALLFDMVKREGAAIVIDGVAPGRDARDAHRAGHRLAAHWRKRYREEALGHAGRPRHRDRAPGDWVRIPLAP